MTHPLVEDPQALLALAAAFALVVTGLARARAWRVLVLLPIGLVVFVYAANPAHRVYSFHGFFHAGIVYALMNGEIPPRNPLFAGRPMLYPWGYELLSAGVATLFRVTPATGFAAINVAALGLTIAALDRIRRRLELDDGATAFAVLSLLGVTCFDWGPIASWASAYWPGRMEARGTPPLSVFTHPTGATLGIALFLLAYDALLEAARPQAEGSRVLPFVRVGLALAAVGFVYPMQFLGMAAAVGLAGIAGAWREGAWDLGFAARTYAAAAAATAALVPYFVSISRGKAETAKLLPAISSAALFDGVGVAIVTIGPMLLIAVLGRRAYADLVRRRPEAVRLGVAFALGAFATFVLLNAPEQAQYKNLILASVATGVGGSLAMRRLCERRPVVFAAVLALLFVPLATDVAFKLTGDWRVTDPLREEGTRLVHLDPPEAALYAWIDANTGTHDVFLDTYLTLPVFARRAIYSAVDFRRDLADAVVRPHDGLGTTPGVALRLMSGYPEEQIRWRQTVVHNVIYSPAPVTPAAFAELRRQATHGRRVYAIARDGFARDKLAADARFEAVFTNDAATIFVVR